MERLSIVQSLISKGEQQSKMNLRGGSTCLSLKYERNLLKNNPSKS